MRSFQFILLLAASLTFSLSHGENLIRNPSFETDADRNECPDHWQNRRQEDIVFIDQAMPMNGRVQVTAVYHSPGEHTLSQPVELKPNTQYTLAGWILGHSAKGNAWLRYQQSNGARQQWATNRSKQGHSDWTLYQTTFTTPAGKVTGQIEFVWQLTDQGIFRFDFASLTEGPTPMPPPNTSPRTRSDHYEVEIDATFGVGAPGLMENDDDPENDNLKVISTTNPSHGAVTFQSDGSFTYRPKNGFTGSDSFSYRVEDEQGGSAEGTVSLTVAKLPPIVNLLANGTFENGLDSWNTGTVYPIYADTNVARSGKASIRFESRSSPHFARQEDLPFKPDKSYRITTWAKGQNIAGGNLVLYYADANGKRRWSAPIPTGTFDWRKFQLNIGTAQEPLNGGSFDILAKFTTGTAWVDDIIVEEISLPYRVFIDGHSVTGGIVPILEEFGRDAVAKGMTDREIKIFRSPNTEKTVILNRQPLDVAMICTWSQKPWRDDLPSEIKRKQEWKRWFANLESPPRLQIYNWQPWGTHLWPDGFDKLHNDFLGVAKETDLSYVPCTLAFTKYINGSESTEQALRQLYFADFHHAGREGNYLKACCAFIGITGKSPVGLTHEFPIDQDFGWPHGTLTRADALRMQKAAWEAWQESNP